MLGSAYSRGVLDSALAENNEKFEAFGSRRRVYMAFSIEVLRAAQPLGATTKELRAVSKTRIIEFQIVRFNTFRDRARAPAFENGFALVVFCASIFTQSTNIHVGVRIVFVEILREIGAASDA